MLLHSIISLPKVIALILILLVLCGTLQAASIDPRQITSDSNSIIVPKSWMQDYRNMARGRSIPSDRLIWQEKDRYHIPIKVAKRYLTLKRQHP